MALVFLPCASGSHDLVDGTAPLRPERHGDVANPDIHRRRDFASRCRGRSAQASGAASQAGASRRGPRHHVLADIANHFDDVGVADVGSSPACEDREQHGQLRRWLPESSFRSRQRALARMLHFGWRVLADVPKHRQLQDLRRVQGGRTDHRLEIRRNVLVLQQPGVEVGEGAAGGGEARRSEVAWMSEASGFWVSAIPACRFAHAGYVLRARGAGNV